MSSLATMVFFLAMAVAIVFWLLFFFVVKVRIADKGLKVVETSAFGFLITKFPYDEMRAYLASLDSDERRRPINKFLGSADVILNALMVVFLILVVAMMVAGA